jgi:NAD(P)-dependent dehydrogenase (short-subunit alcohol dehydrogenase family)
MNTAIEGKIAVVTGSTRGLGYAIAEALLGAGATVVLSGRSAEAVQRAIESLGSRGQVRGWTCDVREEKAVYALARKTVDEFGRIDIWINNAGYSSAAAMVLDLPPAQAVDMFLTNDMGTLYGAQAALHFMRPRREGTIVNLYGAGWDGKARSPTGLYAATKAWVSSFTRTLAVESKGSGVRLVGFSPGMLLTDMLTDPTVIGEGARARMQRYDFVLRLLGKPPEGAARELVKSLARNRREFREVRLFKPWTPFLSLARIAWENLTGRGRRPEYQLHFEDAYKPEI